MERAVILSDDRYFADLLIYEVDGLFTDFRIVKEKDGDLPAGDAYFIDLDRAGNRPLPDMPCFLFTREEKTAVTGRPAKLFSLPFPLGSVRAAVLGVGRKMPRLTLGTDGRTVTLDGRTVRLSEGEFSLLSRLAEAKGGYVGREELLADVFTGASDAGILNVYIHYLRKKLEDGDEKIIFSSRGDGYRLNEKFFGGET